ncbi:hypothetical protein SARC_06998 [Sphaeroforma arctica JP610]|uniref:Serine/threonine-protein phosphatase 4 regulatory subunit 3-like central domain-containing protein n=1 Tax=Sphaeroforma arctica JP610 TaxID=667725 RepID=A0A0L0FUX4_9EUKA|nr:hypothetical protein SARC_06998 [Sphaeroforma arctica JP610]KNC80645.1 hypothetical protein SARC_06998 [Sphaeroforma arctica JP610]|eukprot:XP_014154547.1 hypothetical protein SARC_06998 [Sphaeroforma arctica JP610]
MFVKTLTHDPVSVRQYIIKQFEHNARTPLLQTSIRSFIADTDDGTKTLCGECLRIVLDTDTMTGEKFQFLNRFYDKSFDELIGPLISVPEDQTDHRQYVSDKHNTLYSILELLTSQVLNHATFIKPQLLRNSLIHKLTSLLNDHYTYLSLGAVRFLRALLSLGDESILLCMQKRGVFGSVLSAYVTNGLRYNMLDSAIAELLSYIKGENMKSTIKYIVDHHRETIEKFKDQVAFKGLLQKHAQNEEMSTLETSRSDDVIGSLSQQLTSRYRPDARQLDAEEEDYFDDDDEFTEPSLELTMGSDHALDISMGNAIQPLGTSMENKTRAMAGTSAKNTTVDSLTGTGAGDSEEKLTELDAQAVKEVKERLRQSVYCDTEDNNSVLGGGGSIGASSYHSKNSGDTGLGMGLGRLSSFDTHTPTSTALHTHAAVGAKTGAQSLLERFTGVSDVSTTSMSTNTGTHANAGSHTDVMAHINTNTNGDTAAITSSGEHQSTPVRRTLAIVETPAGDALIENAKPINYSLKGVSDKENTHTGTNAPTQIHADGIDNTAATTLMLNGAVVATNTSASDSATTSSSTQTAGKSTEHVEPFSTADVRNDPAAATSELGSASKPLHNEETKPCAESLVTQDMAFLDSQTKSPEKGGVDTRVDTQTEPAVDTLVKKSVDNSHTSGQGVTRTARTGARRARWDVMGPVAKVEGTSDGVSQSGTQSRTPEHKHADSEVIIPSQPQQEKSGSSDLGPDKSVSTSNVGSTGSTEHPTRTNLDTSDTSRAAEAVIHSGEQVLPAASPAASNASQTCNLMSHQALQGSTTADANAEPKVEALETASVSRPVNAESGDSMRAETLTSTTHSTDTQSGRQEDQLTANTTTTPVATPKGSLNDRIADSSGESMSEANEHSVGASVAKSAGDQGVGLGSGDASKCSGIGPESSESQGDVSFRKRVQLAKSDVATHSSNKDASNSPPKRQRLES